MVGNDAVRFCEHCQLSVNDISRMTPQEAIRLVARSEGRLCVRMVREPDGEVLTRHAPKALLQIGRRVSRVAAGAFSAALSLSSAAAQSASSKTVLPDQVVAQEPAQRIEKGVTLSGIVADTDGAVIPGAVVRLGGAKGSDFTFATTENGAYKFTLLPAGAYKVTALAAAYPATEVEIELTDGDDRVVNLELRAPDVVIESFPSSRSARLTITTGGAVAFIEPEEPLVKAAFTNDLEQVKLLAFSALDLNARDKQTRTTALEQAVENSNLEIVRTLLLAGASTNVKNPSGRTALMYLREDATPDLIRELISGGAKVNSNDNSGGTALMNAAVFCNPPVIRALLDAGATVELGDEDGKTPLMYAAENADEAVSKMLLDAGASINAKDKSGITALMSAARESKPETAKLLLSFNADVNAISDEGWTALMFAVSQGSEDTVKVLLNAGADLSLKNGDGETALAIARAADYPEIIQLLESRGAPD
jgi:ankyrin repeat protein